ncbi:hypothetical protein S245_063963, partial [Arachis hypogaea]
MGLLVAGTEYCGAFEERLKKLMEEIKQSDEIILFIDEMHTLIGAGAAERAIDAVEHIIREENMMAAQEIIELFCELIAVRLPIIEAQRECPLDLKEAISSVCFAAPRCADLPKLL